MDAAVRMRCVDAECADADVWTARRIPLALPCRQAPELPLPARFVELPALEAVQPDIRVVGLNRNEKAGGLSPGLLPFPAPRIPARAPRSAHS